MKTFEEFKAALGQSEALEELDEGALRNLGSAALFARIVSLSKKIRRTKNVGEKLDLIASQNASLAALGVSVSPRLFSRKKN